MSTKNLFRETISNWEDWGRVYQSIPAFSPLAEEIYRRENLPFSPLRHLTPGTNAVFRAGDTVIKIFFPKESGLDPAPDFQNESAVCGYLTEQGISTPRLLAQGRIEDAYTFFYLITEYTEGQEAGEFLSAASPEEKRRFVRELKEILGALNRPAAGVIPPIDLAQRAAENPRLSRVPPTLAEELRRRAQKLDLSQRVLVHGDLTGENLLVTAQKPGKARDLAGFRRLIVIDCADACLAPAWYELGPIVFELFRCDPLLLREFAEGERDFAERVLDSVCLHDFGADLLRTAAEREGIPCFSDLAEVKYYVNKKLSN